MEFYKETKFKETRIGDIPEDWDVVRLGDATERTKGKKPAKLLDEKLENGLPYLTTECMRSNSNIKWCKKEDPNVIKVDKNDLVMIWDGSYSGNVFTGFEGVLVSTMIKISPSENLDKMFLYCFLITKFNFLRDRTSGTGVPHVSKNVFENLSIPLPSFYEQQKIASILSDVDEAIQKTNEIIQKTEKLKKGLMQEILTKGIGHKEFKVSEELGHRIPKEWRISPLGSVCKVIMGQSPPSTTYNEVGDGLSFFQGNLDFGDMYPRVRMFCSRPAKISEANDILVSVRAPIGELNIADRKCCIGRGLAALRVEKGNSEDYIYYLMRHSVKRLVGQGSTFTAVSKKDLTDFKIPLPPPSEQHKIAEILSSVDEKIEKEKQTKEQLEKLKQGLMQTLLTGKVRVRVG